MVWREHASLIQIWHFRKAFKFYDALCIWIDEGIAVVGGPNFYTGELLDSASDICLLFFALVAQSPQLDSAT